jgi:phosphoglycolate phosphatase-like HAD superfamily hydrolase
VVEKVVNAPEILGAENFLKNWYQKIPCFVISATPDEELIEIVRQRGLKVYFKEILGSSRSKKENLELLLNKYGFNALKCLFFGDAGSDYQAAKALSINFIGILPGPEAPLLQQAPEIKWLKDFYSIIQASLNEF